MKEQHPVASPETIAALEFPSLLAMVAELTATNLGRAAILALQPFADERTLTGRSRQVEEISRLLEDGPVVPSIEEPLAPLLETLALGERVLTGEEFLSLARMLAVTQRVADQCREGSGRFAELEGMGAGLASVEDLQRQVRKTFDRRGQVRSSASPKLQRIHQRIRRQRDSLYKGLRDYLQENRKLLAEDTVSVRGGRLAVLLQTSGRGRLPGMIHGSSGTGKSLYFEPLEFVESNNELQQAVEEEEAERRRILHELWTAARQSLPAIEAHAAFLAHLDLLQACHRFAEASGGRVVELAPRNELRLVAARHPLLDPGLAGLRETAIGQPGHAAPVVPLDLELSPRERVLVVTGPNAGGKTVALKTLGLLVLAAQSGLPIPVGPGSRLPLVRRLVASVGDEQDLLADRSTFSGRLLRLREAWESAEPDSLVLLDELGSGTDPEEGAALSIALLEGLLERGGLALVTTHLVPLAAAALRLDEATCAAMQTDPSTLEPTFRLLPGPPGGSEALALARRLGLPAPWLERAESHLSGEARDLRGLLGEVEKIRQSLLENQARLEKEVSEAAQLREDLERERVLLEAEREGLRPRIRAELEEYRRGIHGRLEDEVANLRQQWERGRRRGLAREGVEHLFAEPPPFGLGEPAPGGEVEVGERVRHREQGWSGELEKLARGRAEVRVQGKKVRCRAQDLVPAGEGEGEACPGAGTVRQEGSRGKLAGEVPAELNLVGRRVEPALEALDSYLDRALLASRDRVRIIHGHGTGRLRQAIRHHLESHPAVAAHRPAAQKQGGDGATVVTLKGE